MGGYGALYIGLKHAHMFSKVYGLSSVVYPSDIFKNLSLPMKSQVIDPWKNSITPKDKVIHTNLGRNDKYGKER
jgi:S-formylglutathione hydrolase FrmB